MSEERALPPQLFALTPGDVRASQLAAFEGKLRDALRAGLRGVLLREPELSDRDTLALAERLRRALGPDGYLALHDRVHLAHAAGVRAVHLGFRSLAPPVARALLPHNIAIGWSAHVHDDVTAIVDVDYAFFGPVLATPSKRGIVEPTGFDALRRACERSSVPLWAIGGITPEHARAAVDCGARGIAARAGVLGSQDPAHAVEAYLAALR
ncbi:MAG: thiamine phosphate synthase [Planctomycetota bacterium]